MTKRLDLSGVRFGHLTTSCVYWIHNHGAHWYLLCDCGKMTKASTSNLRKGDIRSCGCQQGQGRAAQLRTHGYTGTRLYRIYRGMLSRCSLPNIGYFDRYGGRGIRVCAEWQKFPPFREWAESNGYRDDLTIERINNDGNYEPGNCRWATWKEQARNRRSTRIITIGGVAKPLWEWLELEGIERKAFEDKERRGYGMEAIFPVAAAKSRAPVNSLISL